MFDRSAGHDMYGVLQSWGSLEEAAAKIERAIAQRCFVFENLP